MRLSIVALVTIAVLQGNSAAPETFAPKTDNEIVAVDLRTGEVLWVHTPAQLSDAHFLLFDDGLIAFPNYSGDNHSDPIFLDPDTGEVTKQVEWDTDGVFARSNVFFPNSEMRLSNGWELYRYSPGNTQTLRFASGTSARVQWRIATGGYPDEVRVWQEMVFYAFSYLSDEGVIYAYQAGFETPSWTVDLNSIVGLRRSPLTRMSFEAIDDVLYVQASEYVFAFQPGSGQLLWQRNLCRDLELQFRPDIYGGGLDIAVFAVSGSVLIVSFERRVVAFDLSTENYLWHLQPDTFPHTPFPLAYGDRLFLTAGTGRELTPVQR